MKTVLFLCRINGARSQIAEAILNRRGNGAFLAVSAGVEPGPAVPKPVLEYLARKGYRTGGLRAKGWREFEGPLGRPLDYVITVCDRTAGEVCPVWPGQPVRAHWDIPDVARGTPEDLPRRLEATHDLVGRCIDLFLSLPEDMMDRLKVARAIDDIARTARGEAGLAA